MHKVLAKRPAALTVDFEDYRYTKLRDYVGDPQKTNPDEVTREMVQLLELFDSIKARATIFSVASTALESPKSLLDWISKNHVVGCHGLEHRSVSEVGEARFLTKLKKSKDILENLFSASVRSFRAPYFSCDGCDPWFGKVLAETGFQFDSSQRLSAMPPSGVLTLSGSEGAVTEVPLFSIGFGFKRLTVIGGTYFRLLPLSIIQSLMARAEAKGFLPVVYLHPYDIDDLAPAIAFPKNYAIQRIGDYVRRIGRNTVTEKLTALAEIYDFNAIETIYDQQPQSSTSN